MILVLGGTSDSIVCNKLNEMNLPYIVSVTTDYGEDIARKMLQKCNLRKT